MDDAVSQTKAEDLELMQGIAQRNSAAFSRLYDKHSGLVYTMALRILRRPTDAEDLVEEVFWEIWDKSQRYDSSRASPITYIVTLTRSRCIDRTRRKSFRQDAGMEIVSETVPAKSDNPSENVEIQEQRALVRSVLADLDENQRQMIEAAYYEGLSQSEIAEKFKKPLGTVKTYIRQGLIRLRDGLRKLDRKSLPENG